MGYDGICLVTFGGPEGPDDVMPFLRNVTRGRDVPDDRLATVAEHYLAFGGVSPINDQARELLSALRGELASRGVDLPVTWGTRNWQPTIADAIGELHAGGSRRILAVTTSAYSSYSGCRQYRENLADAVTSLGLEDVFVEKARAYFDHPGFLAPFGDAVSAALRELAADGISSEGLLLLFTTHSLPLSMGRTSGPTGAFGGDGGAYAAQHQAAAAAVVDLVSATGLVVPEWGLVFQSRSGSPAVPWLEPDINDALRGAARRDPALRAVVVVPIGFVSDHAEVLWDLDREARETCDELGLRMIRVATPGADPRFVAALADLVQEQTVDLPAQALTSLGPWATACPGDCCVRHVRPVPPPLTQPPLAESSTGAPMRIAVVGGGMSGLVSAYALQKRLGDEVDVTVLEAAERVGGKIRTREVSGVACEAGADAFITRAPELRMLVDELGLGEEIVTPASGAYVWSGGRLRAIPPGGLGGVPDRIGPVVRSRLLSLAGLMRAGFDLVAPRTRLAEDPSVGQLVRLRFGNEVFDRLVDPLLGGIYAGTADDLSAASTVPDLAEIARDNRSLFLGLRRRRLASSSAALSGPPLVSVRGGLSRIVDALAARLGSGVVTGAETVAVEQHGSGFTVRTAEHSYDVDAVVLATPAFVSADLVAGLDPELAAELRGIPYAGVANVTFAYSIDAAPALPAGTGFLVPSSAGEFLVGCTWVTQKWPYLRDHGVVIVRGLVGRAGDQRWQAMDDEQLTAAVREGLARITGSDPDPIDVAVQRWPGALPQYLVGHGARLERIDARVAAHPGLHLTGAGYRGVGLAACVAQAIATAARIAVETPQNVASQS